jgi:beta-lactamase class A
MTSAGPSPTISGHALACSTGATLYERDGHRPHYAASLMKTAVLVAVCRALPDGPLHLGTPVDTSTPPPSPFDGRPVVIEPDGHDTALDARQSWTVADLLDRMITVSSNDATNHLLALVGISAVDQVWRDIDATGCTVQRLLYDEAARDTRLTNTATAAGAARLMRAIFHGPLLPADHAQTARRLLLAQQHRDIIPAALPATLAVGNKEGAATGLRHDMAHITGPNGRCVSAAVLVTGPYTFEEAEREACSEAARVATTCLDYVEQGAR